MTANGMGLYDCVLPSVGNDKVILGGLEMLPIACYGKFDLIFYSLGDVVANLNNATQVLGLGLNWVLRTQWGNNRP